MELTRKQVIEILEKADSTIYKEPKTKTAYALEYAISSLKTDEAYQIMYEGGEIFTKDDVVAMMTELQLEIEESENCGKAFHLGLQMASNIIQQKIDALRGDNNENMS